MPSIDFFKNMKLAKEQVDTITNSNATSKSLGLDQNLANETNSKSTYILSDIESKIPIDAVTKWFDVKNDMRARDKEPTLKDFIKFYEQMAYSINKAQYLRSAMDSINACIDLNKRGRNKSDDTYVDKRYLLAIIKCPCKTYLDIYKKYLCSFSF